VNVLGAKKLTIYDIAKQANVSSATVSLVLNGKWQSQRISQSTAQRILKISQEASYNINQKARALRLNQSGMVGMIIPEYGNRFFAGLSESFESEARERGLCPVVVSAHRESQIEEKVINTLVAHQIEFLFIVGAKDPEQLRKICWHENIRCVNIDLPGEGPSIVTDNYKGTFRLVNRMLEDIFQQSKAESDELYFIGGVEDYATENRVAGFKNAVRQRGLTLAEDHIRICGYEARDVEKALEELYEQLGKLPKGIFINSITALEGVVRFLKRLPFESYAEMVIGCFDWDPLAAFLSIPIFMIRQDTERLIAEAYHIIDDYPNNGDTLIKVPPLLIEPDIKV